MGEVRKIIVIGLDGATPQLIWPWIKEGKLPTLQRLITEGVHGELRSTIPPLSPTAWSSFATGKNPGKHGVYDHVRRRSGYYELEPMNALNRRGQTLWQLLSEYGYRVGVVNVPGTYPPASVNGYLVTGMYTPSKEVTYTHPASLSQELDLVTGGYALFSDSNSRDDYSKILADLHETRANRVQAISYLLDKHKTDFFMFVFDETDRAQHKFWKFVDKTHPLYQPSGIKRYKDAILELHQKIDEDLAYILETCDDKTVTIIMSDHGFGPLYKIIYLNNWLLELGYLKLKTALTTRAKHFFYRSGITPANLLNLSTKLKLRLAGKAISAAKKARSKKSKGLFRPLLLSASDVDWSATTAYAMGGNLAGVYLNVKGREPQGIVEPGREYETLRRELIKKLESMTDPDTGDCIFSDILCKEDAYSGACLEQAPDIVFLTNHDRYIAQGAQEFMFTTNKTLGIPRWPSDSGTHQRDGILIMHGHPFQSGKRLEGADIMDLAPTILSLMDVPIPTDMDGKVLETAFRPQYLKRNPVRYTTPISEEEMLSDSVNYTAEEEAAIAKRLEDLGYLG